MNANKIVRILLPLILLLTGLYLVPLQIFHADLSKVSGDLVDSRFNNYVLEHGYLFFKGSVNKYWDAPFMYPFHNVIAFSDNLLGIVPIYSFFRMIGADRETAYQLLFISLFILNFICCYWALNKWSQNVFLSSTGAYIFAFSIFIYVNIYHIQNFPRFIIPLVFYWLWKYLTEKKTRYFLLTLLGIAFQLYCAIYLGFFLIYGLLFLILAYIIVTRDLSLFKQFKDWRIIIKTSSILVLFFVLLHPLLSPYIEISRLFGMRKFEDAINTIPTLRSYFLSTEAAAIWNFLSHHSKEALPEYWCHTLFLGLLPWLGILCSVYLIISKRTSPVSKKLITVLFIGWLLSMLFCLNFNGMTLYRLVFELPGFSSMRAIHRVINIESVFFILLMVFSVKELSMRNSFMKYFIYALPLIVIIDNYPDMTTIITHNKSDSQKRVLNVRKTIEDTHIKEGTEAIAYLTNEENYEAVLIHLDVMLASQELGIPCVNGYSGTCPGAFNDFWSYPGSKSLIKWLNYAGGDLKQTRIINNSIALKRIQLEASNKKFVCADLSSNNMLTASRDTPGSWETFTLDKLRDQKFAIKASDNRFWSSELTQQGVITSVRSNVGEWENFELVFLLKDTVAIKAINKKYLTLNVKDNQLYATGDSIGALQKFVLFRVE
ncbi:MAG: hypothetical protein K0Q95_2204 [Bacteroidota bacterium]|jgi:hypothetical protein|nr:hypothetical protein [Bacteroidota bacterium]